KALFEIAAKKQKRPLVVFDVRRGRIAKHGLIEELSRLFIPAQIFESDGAPAQCFGIARPKFQRLVISRESRPRLLQLQEQIAIVGPCFRKSRRESQRLGKILAGIATTPECVAVGANGFQGPVKLLEDISAVI